MQSSAPVKVLVVSKRDEYLSDYHEIFQGLGLRTVEVTTRSGALAGLDPKALGFIVMGHGGPSFASPALGSLLNPKSKLRAIFAEGQHNLRSALEKGCSVLVVTRSQSLAGYFEGKGFATVEYRDEPITVREI